MSHRVQGWLFVAVQALLLGMLVFLPGREDWPLASWASSACLLVAYGGLIVVCFAAFGLGSALTATPVPKAKATLRTGGLYRHTRHPIYTGVLAFVVGTVIGSRSFWKLAVGLVLVAFFIVKARWEEERLHAAYPDYAAYAERTPRFVPRPTPRRR